MIDTKNNTPEEDQNSEDQEQPEKLLWEQKLWSIEELASVLHFSPGSVRRWCRDGKIKSVKIINQWRVPHSEVVRIISMVEPTIQKAVEILQDSSAKEGKVDGKKKNEVPWWPF